MELSLTVLLPKLDDASLIKSLDLISGLHSSRTIEFSIEPNQGYSSQNIVRELAEKGSLDLGEFSLDLEQTSYVPLSYVWIQPYFRLRSRQWPLVVENVSFPDLVESKEDIDGSKVRDIVETCLKPTVITFHPDYSEFGFNFFLPEAVSDDPFKRKLKWEFDPLVWFEEYLKLSYENVK
ncbi:hypothetical protein DRJ25_05925 [Candidatus Woesearchaeota archaeon]|nr:MAG: hypothetical protein DRJ25_05925 [Candidatus Woesearchaeota archaeon]